MRNGTIYHAATASPFGFPGGSEVKASACIAGDLASIPGSGRSPGEGNGKPLQYSHLENSMNRGFWQATVYGVAKSQTQWNDFHIHTFQVVLAVKNPSVNAGDIRNLNSIPGSGISLGKGNGSPLQYTCLGNPMDRGPGGLQSMGLQRVGHD